MICFLHRNYEYEGQEWVFVDFGTLSEVTIATLVELASTHTGRDDPWKVEGWFPTGDVSTMPWTEFIRVQDCFTYQRSRRSGGGREYRNIQPVKTLDALSPFHLRHLAHAFREYLEDEQYDHHEGGLETVLIPIFEQYVEARR